MRILLINPSLRFDSPHRILPIGLAYIATAIKRAGYDFDLLDIDLYRYTNEEIDGLIKKQNYDIVALGCIVTGYRHLKEITSKVRRIHPMSIIIAGNSVATSIPEIILRNTEVDIAVIGEGDTTIVELIKAIEEKKRLKGVKGIAFLHEEELVLTDSSGFIKDVTNVPFVDYSIFNTELYIENLRGLVPEPIPLPRELLRALPVNTARGCIARCTFCYHVFKEYPYRRRSTKAILLEIAQLIERYRLNYIFFWDELTFYSKRQADEFVSEILALNLKFYWGATCRADLFDDEADLAIIDKMRMAGCRTISYSLESSNPDILKSMNKHISAEQFAKQTSLFQKADIVTLTSLVFGYPEETPETIKEYI